MHCSSSIHTRNLRPLFSESSIWYTSRRMQETINGENMRNFPFSSANTVVSEWKVIKKSSRKVFGLDFQRFYAWSSPKTETDYFLNNGNVYSFKWISTEVQYHFDITLNHHHHEMSTFVWIGHPYWIGTFCLHHPPTPSTLLPLQLNSISIPLFRYHAIMRNSAVD